jgi:hypothetical protein
VCERSLAQHRRPEGAITAFLRRLLLQICHNEEFAAELPAGFFKVAGFCTENMNRYYECETFMQFI